MRHPLRLALLVLLTIVSAQAKPLLGGPKTVTVDPSGVVEGIHASPKMAQGSYLKGASQVAVPLIAVAFESSAKARVSHATSTERVVKSLELHLVVERAVQEAVVAALQEMVEKDLVAQGFQILPKDSIDTDPRWLGISKEAVAGEEVKDNFMSGFMGNGSMNRWYAAGGRPLFGIGATGVMSETGPLIRTAREKKFSLLFYRFKVQFTDLEGKNGIVFHYVKGKNVLHVVSADLYAFTPEHTLGGVITLTDDLVAGTDFVQELEGSPGRYNVIADPEAYKANSLLLLGAISKQFAQALRKAQ